MHFPTTALVLLTSALDLATACVSIPGITYTGFEKGPNHSFDGIVFIDGKNTCHIKQLEVNQFSEDKDVCVDLTCNPGHRMKLCRRIGDDWWIVLSTEYGEEGKFKEETVWLDVEDRGHHERTLRLEWSGCAKKNWQEVWFTTEVLKG